MNRKSPLQFLTRVGLICGVLAMFAMAFHIGADVVGKTIFSHPLAGTLEIVAFYYMVACTFFGLPYVQTEQANITADIIDPFLTDKLRLACHAFAEILTAAFFLLAGSASLTVAVQRTLGRETVDATVVELWLWPSRWIVAFGFLISGIVAFRYVYSRNGAPE